MTEIKTEQIDYLHVMQKIETCHTQKELADEVGLSVGKVNYIIKALLEKGFIKAESFVKSFNKRAYKYPLTSDGLKNKILLTKKYIAIRKQEYEKLQENLHLDKQRSETNVYIVAIPSL